MNFGIIFRYKSMDDSLITNLVFFCTTDFPSNEYYRTWSDFKTRKSQTRSLAFFQKRAIYLKLFLKNARVHFLFLASLF